MNAPLEPTDSRRRRPYPHLAHEHVQFLRHLSWSVLGGTFGAGLMFVAGLLAGRMLGPEAFGRASLGLLIGQVFAVFATFGLDIAASRLLPKAGTDSARAALVTTMLVLMVPCLITLAVLAIALTPLMAHPLNVSHGLVRIGIGVGIVIAVRIALDRQVAALRLFRFQSLLKLVEGAIAVGVLCAFTSELRNGTSNVYLLALAVAGSVVALTSVIRVQRFIAARAFSRNQVRPLVRYGAITLLHAVTPAGFVYFDRITVKSGAGEAGLGLYMAYYTASFLIVGQVTAVITNVLMPYSAERSDQTGIVQLLWRIRRATFFVAFLGFLAVGWLILTLGFGSSYNYSVGAGACAALWATLLLYNGLATTIAITFSERSFLFTVLFQAVRSAVFLTYGGILLAVDGVTITRVLLGMALLEVLDALNLDFVLRRIVLRRPDPAQRV